MRREKNWLKGGAGPATAQWWGGRPVATAPPARVGLLVVPLIAAEKLTRKIEYKNALVRKTCIGRTSCVYFNAIMNI